MGPIAYFANATYLSFLSSLNRKRGIVVLMYHRIRDDIPPGPLIVSSKVFREQMKYLKKYADVIGIRQLLPHYAEHKPIPSSRRPMVVVTIDDGYRDTFVNAYPVLKEFNLQATVFLATDFIGTGKKMTRYSHLPGVDMLSWEEVQTMLKSGLISFAAHTQSHPDLSKLIYTQQRNEITGSIRTVGEHIADDVVQSVFCYTYGRYNGDTLRILKETGIKLAFTVQYGWNTGKENPLELKRICADGTYPLVDFMRRLNPMPAWLQWRCDVVRGFLHKKLRKKL